MCIDQSKVIASWLTVNRNVDWVSIDVSMQGSKLMTNWSHMQLGKKLICKSIFFTKIILTRKLKYK